MKYLRFILSALILTLSMLVSSVTAQIQVKAEYRPPSQNSRQPVTITDLSKLPADFPAKAVELNNAAVQKSVSGKYQEAFADFESARKQFPTCARISINMAINLGYLKQFPEAIAILKELLNSQPNLQDAHATLGGLLLQNGETENAIASLQKAIELDPNDAFALTDLGNCYSDKKMFKEAIKLFDRAIKINPTIAYAYNNKGSALVGLGNYKDAVAAFQKVISLDKNCSEAFNNLGVVLSAQGKKKEAHEAYREAVRLRPNWGVALYNLALSFLDMGDREQASVQMRALSTVDPQLAIKVQDQLWAKYVVNAAKVN
jgi:tetratricopeptide (TPR) repeat protein